MLINGYELSVAQQEFPEEHWHNGLHFRNDECVEYNCSVFDLTEDERRSRGLPLKKRGE